MERNRDARRGPMAAVNGGGSSELSRRRQKNSSRDSPDEDAGMEIPETLRLRDRGGGGGEKKYRDRDRDRSRRSKRRRGERSLHGSSNRDDVDDSSEDSLEEEEDDDDDLTVRIALPSHPPATNPSSSSSSQLQLQQQNHHNYYQHHHHHHQQHSQLQQQQQRKSFPPKSVRPPVAWKADEMIGVAVPRKARSASVKRSHESSVSSGGAGAVLGTEEQIPRQASISPSRLSPASATQISPSSSNASIRKKMKPMSGNKHRPPKISKASSSSVTQDDIEMEVAEVLFGLTRQQYCPPKQEVVKVDSRELNGTSVNEARSGVSSPSSISPCPASHPSVLPPSNSSSNPSMITIAPKRKKPRPVKFDDESPTSSVAGHAVPNSSIPSAVKLEADNLLKTQSPSPRAEQNSTPLVVENGDSVPSAEVAVPQISVSQPDIQLEASKVEGNQNPDLKLSARVVNTQELVDCMDETVSASESNLCANLDVNLTESTASKQVAKSPRKEKLNIDLMAPPPGKFSIDGEDERNFDSDQKPTVSEPVTALKASNEKKDQEMLQVNQATKIDGNLVDRSARKDMDSRKQMSKEQTLNLRLDLEKTHKDDSSGKLQIQKQQQKPPKVEPTQDKSAPTMALNMPMAVGAWPGGFPSFGYMGQVPSLPGVIPMDGSAVPSSALQPSAFFTHQHRQKRCATHLFIAQTIHNYQKFARMNPFWSAANSNSIYGAQAYNLNIMPPSEATLFINPMQGGFPARHMGSSHDTKNSTAGSSAYSGHPSTDRIQTTNNPVIEVAQRKQLGLQQMPLAGSNANMLHGPAFIFPINQQQAAAAADRAPAAKSTSGVGNVTPTGASSSAAGSSGTSGIVSPMNLSFTGLPTGDAQYLAMLQSSPYPFPLPPHVAGASPFRGATPGQAMPYFFPSHILHPSQIQSPPPQQQQVGSSQTSHAQQNHQKPSTSSGSSSSQKHPQPSHLINGLVGAGSNTHGYPASSQRQPLQPQQARQQDFHKGSEENPSTSEGRAFSHVQKGMYGQPFSIPVHHQNFFVMSPAAAAAVVGNPGGQGDKQILSQQQQKQNVKIDLTSSPPAFTMPFTSFNGEPLIPGLDFSSMSQNHTIFQNQQEAARHGYHHIAIASQVAQNKKQTTDDGKYVGRNSINSTVIAEDERKTMPGGKIAGSGMQHSLTFLKTGETSNPISSILNSSAMDSSSRTHNLIQAPGNGGRNMNRPLGGLVPTSSMAMGTSNAAIAHQNQQMLQLQKQQLQQGSLSCAKSSVSTNSSSIHSDQLSGSTTVAKFPQALTGFPQAVMQDGSLQSPQVKTSSGRASTPVTTSASPIVKSNHLIQQVRSAQQPLSAQSHQTQISFGINSFSPSNSVSKSAGGSPKPAPATVGHSQSSFKASASSSASKTSPVGNMPSILGHPHNTSASNSSTKLQHQQMQAQKQQPFPQPQFYFTNAYMQQPHVVQSSNAGVGTASGYYQKRQTDQ